MRTMTTNKKFITIGLCIVAATTLFCSLPIPAIAVPIKYELYKSGTTSPSGWFIYDRDTSTLSDYLISFDSTSYPVANFVYPGTSVTSANSDGFTFYDQTTTYGLGQNFTVYLNHISFNFFTGGFTAGSDGLGRPLIGDFTDEIYYSGEYIGAIMYLPGHFAEVGPTGNNSPVPEPATLTLLGLGLAGFMIYGKRRQKST